MRLDGAQTKRLPGRQPSRCTGGTSTLRAALFLLFGFLFRSSLLLRLGIAPGCGLLGLGGLLFLGGPGLGRVVIVVGHQFVARYLLVIDGDLAEQVVDHLLLEQRRADIGERLWVVAVELVDLALPALRETPHRIDKRAL